MLKIDNRKKTKRKMRKIKTDSKLRLGEQLNLVKCLLITYWQQVCNPFNFHSFKKLLTNVFLYVGGTGFRFFLLPHPHMNILEQKASLFASIILKLMKDGISKGRTFSEKDWYYLQAQTDMPFHYLKLVVWIFPLFYYWCQ